MVGDVGWENGQHLALVGDIERVEAEHLARASDLAANRGTEQDERAVAESRNEAIGSLSRLAPMVPADVAAGIYGQIDAIARGWVTVPALFPDTLRRWALAWRAFADRS